MINIRLNRINEQSAKWILLVMQKLSIILPEHKFVINWYYRPTNSNMQISGERIKLNSYIPVNLIAA